MKKGTQQLGFLYPKAFESAGTMSTLLKEVYYAMHNQTQSTEKQ
jgi:hypothetical protein